jgi:hypothetical protein
MKTKTKKPVNILNDVNEIIYNMFVENTGAHIADSGGAYGRHHERNRAKAKQDFIFAPSVTYEIWGREKTKVKTSENISITVNCYQYLINNDFKIDDICKRFNKMNINSKDWGFDGAYGVCEKAGNYLVSLGAEISDGFNTYNDSAQFLSQVIQGHRVTIGDEVYYILQVHQGCDVRGGYTDARLFKLNKYQDYINPIEVRGVINDKPVDTGYNGWSLTDEVGNFVKLKKDNNVIDLYI